MKRLLLCGKNTLLWCALWFLLWITFAVSQQPLQRHHMKRGSSRPMAVISYLPSNDWKILLTPPTLLAAGFPLNRWVLCIYSCSVYFFNIFFYFCYHLVMKLHRELGSFYFDANIMCLCWNYSVIFVLVRSWWACSSEPKSELAICFTWMRSVLVFCQWPRQKWPCLVRCLHQMP